MKKRFLVLLLTLSMIAVMFYAVPASAAGVSIVLSKTEFRLDEPGTVTVSGLTQGEIDDGAWLAVEEATVKLDNSVVQEYISNLPEGNVWEFTAPSHFGTFEVRLFNGDNSLIGKVSFTVKPVVATTDDIKLSATTPRLSDKMSVTIKGLTEGEIYEGVWIGIEKQGTKIENTVVAEYVDSLDADGVYNFTAPSEFGKYEVRVIYPDNKTVYGIASFDVVPGVAGPDDIKLSDTMPRLNDKMTVTVKGLTDGEIEDGVWIGIEKQGTKLENTVVAEYVDNLDADGVYKFTAPSEFGKYEVRVIYPDNKTMYGIASFEVVPGIAQEGDIVLTKNVVKLNEKIKLTVNGLTDEEISAGVWVGIEKVGTKIENTVIAKYLSDFDVNNSWEFEAPAEFGRYEVRVIYPDGKTMFGTASFDVISSKAEAGDIVLSSNSVRPGEALALTVNGLTEGEINSGAWVGFELVGTKLENTVVAQYLSEFDTNNSWQFTAPYTAGTYEVRVFCSSSLDADQYEYALFGITTFTVSGEAVTYSEGYEDLSSWAVGYINDAVTDGLVTDDVMSDFKQPITREEFCELVVNLYERMTGKTAEPIAANPFTDTTNPEILKAYNLGIVNGVSADKFAPESSVTREQIATMFVRALKVILPQLNTADAQFTQQFYDINDVSAWAMENLKFLNARGIFQGSEGYILPKANCTREQAITLVKRVFDVFFQI